MKAGGRHRAVLALGALLVAGLLSPGGARSQPAGGACAPPPFSTDGNGFDPADFGPDSNVIDNRFLPLEPGTRWVHRGSSLEGRRRVRHRVVFTATDLTKEVACVRTLVGWDRDFVDGELVEKELIFLAQDLEGNVWHLGQYAEIYDGEQFDGAAPWLVGYLQGARAGVLMPADPRVGTPAYSEGYAPPPYFWDDHARVIARGRETCVPAGCFEHVLVIEEFEPTKPGAFQIKFYAPGVGPVRTGWRGPNEEEQEVLVLAEVQRLDEAAMARVRAEALAMEARGTVYGLTAPLEAPASPTG
ncbi:MAG TPA: hypothetical protein VNO79_02275 [Actinomycetota bacterium]|nr:hypothetical protein [Actinomycetota bacterium]